MGFKSSDKCLEKVADDEPIFVLRAQDKLAPALIDLWVDLAALHGCPEDKLREAREQSVKMALWAERNAGGGKWPD